MIFVTFCRFFIYVSVVIMGGCVLLGAVVVGDFGPVFGDVRSCVPRAPVSWTGVLWRGLVYCCF